MINDAIRAKDLRSWEYSIQKHTDVLRDEKVDLIKES